MRILLLPLAALALTAIVPVDGADARWRDRDRDQQAALRGTQQGDILPLTAIRSRINVPGAEFIGAEFDSRRGVYRLKYMRRGGDVLWIDVDARTGRQLGQAGH